MTTNKNSAKKDFFENLNEITSVVTERKVPGNTNESKLFYKPDEAAAPEKKPEEKPAQKTDDKKEQESGSGEKVLDFDPVASGKNTAILVAGTIESVFTLAERLMWAFGRFSFEEKEIILKIIDKEADKLTDREKEINRKFLRIDKQHKAIQEKLDFTEDEKEAMAEGFAEYSKQTGKSMSPKVIPWIIITKALIGRTTDILL